MCENKIFNEAMAVFLKQFHPAASPSESDEELSTSEINNILSDLIDSGTNEKIYGFLKQEGFKYEFIGGGFKWLLKKV